MYWLRRDVESVERCGEWVPTLPSDLAGGNQTVPALRHHFASVLVVVFPARMEGVVLQKPRAASQWDALIWHVAHECVSPKCWRRILTVSITVTSFSVVSKSGACVAFFQLFPHCCGRVSWHKVGVTVSSEENISWRQSRTGCSGVGLFNYLEFFFKLLSLSLGIVVVFFGVLFVCL